MVIQSFETKNNSLYNVAVFRFILTTDMFGLIDLKWTLKGDSLSVQTSSGHVDPTLLSQADTEEDTAQLTRENMTEQLKSPVTDRHAA